MLDLRLSHQESSPLEDLPVTTIIRMPFRVLLVACGRGVLRRRMDSPSESMLAQDDSW